VRYIAQRLLQLVGVLLVVTFLTFLMVRLLPGDPVLSVTGLPKSAAEDPQYADRIAAAKADLNLDKSVPVAYVDWLSDMLHGDLGYSYVRNTPVNDLIGTALPRTLLLMLYSIVLSLVIAVPLGVLTAHRQSTWLDRVLSTGAFGTIAVPNFVLATVLVYVFAIKLGWFPATDVKDLGDVSLFEHLKSYTLPVLSLSLGQAAVFMRLLRTDMISTLSEDFIGMAKAKGMPVRRILLSHALRPSSFTLLTVTGINVGQLIGGSVIIEAIFAINGMGSQIAAAVLRSDYVLVQSGVALIAIAFVTINFAVDILYGVLDPRVRHARSSH
jgi:peptide/nickel transport system permease protein